MEQVIGELEAWLTFPSDPIGLDTDAFKRMLNEKIGAALNERQVHDAYREKFKNSTRRLEELLKPINEQLTSLYEHSKIGLWRDDFAEHFLTPTPTLGNPVPLESYQRCSLVDPLDRVDAVTLRLGWGLQLYADGSTTLRMLVVVKSERFVGMFYTWFLDPLSAEVGSIAEERNFKVAVQQVTEQLRIGITDFIERQPKLGP